MLTFNGTELLIPEVSKVQVAGDACPMGLGGWNPDQKQYFSCKFPLLLQDPTIPIHIKEFICLIISVKLWGKHWTGKQCVLFCDNDSVCDVVTYLKPKDSLMQKYLREFLYWVCKYNFKPVVSKMGTKENYVADYMSRCYDPVAAKEFFIRENIPALEKIDLTDNHFQLKADW